MKTKTILLVLLISSLAFITSCVGNKEPASTNSNSGTAINPAASATQDSYDVEVNVEIATDEYDFSSEAEKTYPSEETVTLPAEENVEIELND